MRRATLGAKRRPCMGRISIHALLAESDRAAMSTDAKRADFYPRSPCGERLHDPMDRLERNNISIHALLAESDAVGTFVTAYDAIFLSTLSLRRATSGPFCRAVSFSADFYPRSPCGERLWTAKFCYSKLRISIHALLAESDPRSDPAPWAQKVFLSTLSLRRATVSTTIIIICTA